MDPEKANQYITRNVSEIMMEFAEMTGLLSVSKVPRRYLWTDAFAVCNFLELHRRTGDGKYKDLALRLVDQVHNLLGRHRSDDTRSGWISGLGEEEGKRHPTLGGLRIGEKNNERKQSDQFDEDSEWGRDGQYYHYLTKWMQALNCVSRAAGDPIYNIWAVELAKTAHKAFVYAPPGGGRKRMFWKMSIDLSNPLVSSMGHHDPLEGFITYHQLQATSFKYPEGPLQPDISAEIDDMASICEGKIWTTDDPLGLGDLLCGMYKVAKLIINEGLELMGFLNLLLDSSPPGLTAFARKKPLELPADYRLAFRELGLSIGLKAVKKLQELIQQDRGRLTRDGPTNDSIEILMRHAALGKRIEEYWLDPVNQEAGTWTSHREINMVMLATSLAPDGYLTF